MVETDNEKVSVLVTQEKWDKSRRLLGNIYACFQPSGHQILPFKKLESAQGYLVYTTRSYPSMVPYLKGIHLTLDSWRDGRDQDGWRSGQKTVGEPFSSTWLEDPDDWLDLTDLKPWTWDKDLGLKTYQEESQGARSDPPTYVKAGSCLNTDIQALMFLMKEPLPHRRTIRSTSCLIVRYGFGDASGVGFGAAFVGEVVTTYCVGEWN